MRERAFEEAVAATIRDNPEMVAKWRANEPGAWGFLAGRGVLEARQRLDRKLTEGERRVVWALLWQRLTSRERASLSSTDYGPEFYRRHARRYAQVAHEFRQSVYVRRSHPRLRSDLDAWERLKELAPGGRGLDAGCGAGARDVFRLWSEGYDIVGVDAVEENIRVARELHPEIADRVSVADLTQPLPFADASFDFVACNAVIQHIDPDTTMRVTLPELVRVLRPGGVLQLMFKNGSGVITVHDPDYGEERAFQLYDERELLRALEEHGMALVEAESAEEMGGLLHFTDPKGVEHCLLYARKGGS